MRLDVNVHVMTRLQLPIVRPKALAVKGQHGHWWSILSIYPEAPYQNLVVAIFPNVHPYI
jgi:hypothetical protein